MSIILIHCTVASVNEILVIIIFLSVLTLQNAKSTKIKN